MIDKTQPKLTILLGFGEAYAWKHGVYILFLLLRCPPLFPAVTSPPSFPAAKASF